MAQGDSEKNESGRVKSPSNLGRVPRTGNRREAGLQTNTGAWRAGKGCVTRLTSNESILYAAAERRGSNRFPKTQAAAMLVNRAISGLTLQAMAETRNW
ncbi:hypothetical protein E4U27_002624 [Claviceps purpurea]|nr:hypothetical protein E4U27_002624 [Claviceps purpurea]